MLINPTSTILQPYFGDIRHFEFFFHLLTDVNDHPPTLHKIKRDSTATQPRLKHNSDSSITAD